MPKQVNPIQVKNKAVCVVFSWMRAWDIEARLPERQSEGDLVVGGKAVTLSESPTETDLTLSPAAILGADLNATLTELHRLTQFLGRGKPAGFRNVTGMTRASPDDYLGVSMRLTPFGRTPNIPAEDILKWRPVLKREADRAARRCAGILFNMGLDRQDLFNIGLVYLTNFLARHQSLGNEDETGKHLTMSLMQQYGRWANVTIRHLKSVAPVTAGLPIDFVMGSPCPNSSLEDAHGTDREASYTFDPEMSAVEQADEPQFSSVEEEQSWLRRKAMKDGRYHAKRRRNAKAALDLALAEMPHDRMLFVLSEVRDSDFHHPDAREEAQRRIIAHQGECAACVTSTAQK